MSSDFDLFNSSLSEKEMESINQRKELEREEVRAFASVFNSPEGKVVMRRLKAMTLNQPSLKAYGADGINTGIMMAYEEGAKGIVRFIVKQVEKDKED